MTRFLLDYICEPITKNELFLRNDKSDIFGNIISGELVSSSGKIYPIIDGIPRFVDDKSLKTVESFGNEWNYFNFVDFKINWLNHTVFNTFGNVSAFSKKVIVDAGGGSGAQTKWFIESGAKHVILLELSHSVDFVAKNNLSGLKNVDIIQCSIDTPPLKDNSVNGIVYCHNVIQHTASVENTAHSLYSIVAPGGEFVFNCYPLNNQGFFRWLRFNFIYKPLRFFLSRMPFFVICFYAKSVAFLRLIPIFGWFLEKLGFVCMGDVPAVEGEGSIKKTIRRFKTASLNTFDCYGSHQYQHYKSDKEIYDLVLSLQPNISKVLNINKYFLRPKPVGCALRVFK